MLQERVRSQSGVLVSFETVFTGAVAFTSKTLYCCILESQDGPLPMMTLFSAHSNLLRYNRELGNCGVGVPITLPLWHCRGTYVGRLEERCLGGLKSSKRIVCRFRDDTTMYQTKVVYGMFQPQRACTQADVHLRHIGVLSCSVITTSF